MNSSSAIVSLPPTDTGEALPAVEPAPTLDPLSAPVPTTGAQSIVKSLEALDVEVVFGLSGGAILFDSSQVRHVRVRHEQGAGHAATGYAQATGKVGVCFVTSGHGATNLITSLADAQADSVPVVAITGQVGHALIGTDAFQDVDICGVTMPITKHNVLVTDPVEIPQAIAEAFHIASTGRPGVVLVDIPKDVLQAATAFCWPPKRDLPGYRVVTGPHPGKIRAAAELITALARPVLYVGGGVIKAEAAPELRELVELTGIPVVTTLMARGAFPDGHPLHYGMPGMHGTVAAVAALQRSDLLITLGARFDDRVTGEKASFAPHAKVIHIDIDPAEIGKNRAVDVPIVGNCKNIIGALVERLRAVCPEGLTLDLTGWHDELDTIRDAFPLGYTRPSSGALAPEQVIEAIGRAAGPDAIYVAGVGQHQMWAANFISYDRPRSWLNSGGLGTMGYAVPAALGAKLGVPDREVWTIDGDGCFQMTNRELATAAIEGIPLKVAVINNGNLGMVRQLQHVHYEGRFSNVDLATHTRRIPDFALLAEALGCVALRCEHEDDLDDTIAAAQTVTDRPVVIDFMVDNTALVWPMIAAGTSNDDIILGEGIRPVFGEVD